MDKITLTIYKTANGFYVEHEADNLKQSYSVECEADEWEKLNPALRGIETLFSAEEAEAAEDEADNHAGTETDGSGKTEAAGIENTEMQTSEEEKSAEEKKRFWQK